MKKINMHNVAFRKFAVVDYRKELHFAQDPKFKFRFATFNTRTQWYKKYRHAMTLDEARRYFAYRTVLCVLYENEEALIVLEGDKHA